MKIQIKQIPNIITVFRIFCSFTLLFLNPLSIGFFLIYFAGGLSDVLDGFIARKLKITSKLGATLDSIADAAFIFVLLKIFLTSFKLPIWPFFWIAGILIIRLASLTIGFFKYLSFSFLHTYANKAAGLALFCFPLLYILCGLSISLIFLCCIATVSALEELLINIISPVLDRDISSIFSVFHRD